MGKKVTEINKKERQGNLMVGSGIKSFKPEEYKQEL